MDRTCLDPDASTRENLTDLFNQVASFLRLDCSGTNSNIPRWPVWSADYIVDRLAQILNIEFTRGELISLLYKAEEDWKHKEPKGDWSQYYANLFLNLYPAPKGNGSEAEKTSQPRQGFRPPMLYDL